MNRLAALALAAFTGIAGASDSAFADSGNEPELTPGEMCKAAQTEYEAIFNCVGFSNIRADQIDADAVYSYYVSLSPKDLAKLSREKGKEEPAGAEPAKEGTLLDRVRNFKEGQEECQMADHVQWILRAPTREYTETGHLPPDRKLTAGKKELLGLFTENRAACSWKMAEFYAAFPDRWAAIAALSHMILAQDLEGAAALPRPVPRPAPRPMP